MIAAITGASSGIGYEVAQLLQNNANLVVFLGRGRQRFAGLLREHDLFVECELASLASVAAAAETITKRFSNLDLLVNNAGSGGKRGVTEDGFELTFGINYLSHYLLTRKLGNLGRVVNVSSEAHRGVRDLSPERGVGRTKSLLGWPEYQFSKAAQIAFTLSLSARGANAYSVHPGVTATNLWRRVPQPFRAFFVRSMQAPAVGAIPVLRACTDLSLNPGEYVTPQGVIAPNPIVNDPLAAERLWEQSEKWVASYLP